MISGRHTMMMAAIGRKNWVEVGSIPKWYSSAPGFIVDKHVGVG